MSGMDLVIDGEKVVLTADSSCYSVTLDYVNKNETLVMDYLDYETGVYTELSISSSEVGKDNLKYFLKEVLARLEEE